MLDIMRYLPLSDGHEDRLVVGSTGHGADTVVTSRETTSDSGAQASIAVASVIDTLEEGELRGIQSLARGEGVTQVLDGDVSVANNGASVSKLLRSRVVGVVGVGEGTQVHVGDLNVDIEVLVRLRLFARHRARDDGRGHFALRGNLTHGDTVAGSLLVLLTIGQCLAGAEVDEVVGISFGSSLARLGTRLLSIRCRAFLDSIGLQTLSTIVATVIATVVVVVVVVWLKC